MGLLSGLFGGSLRCPMCGGKHRRAVVSTVRDEKLKIERPSAPCPHCGYDPYEPFAVSRWSRRQEAREEQLQRIRHPDESAPPEGIDPDEWREFVRWHEARKRAKAEGRPEPPLPPALARAAAAGAEEDDEA